MKCPRCGTELLRVGLEELAGDAIFVTLECPACHFSMQKKIGRRKAPL